MQDRQEECELLVRILVYSVGRGGGRWTKTSLYPLGITATRRTIATFESCIGRDHCYCITN